VADPLGSLVSGPGRPCRGAMSLQDDLQAGARLMPGGRQALPSMLSTSAGCAWGLPA